MQRLNRVLIVVLALLVSRLAVAGEEGSWLRIDNPSAELRQQLTGVAIEYPNFLWLPKIKLPKNAALKDMTVQVIHAPFHFNIDNQYLDLSLGQLPANVWFQDLTISRGNDSLQLYIVQFNGPIKAEWLSALKAKNIQPIKPLAPFSWIVWTSPQQLTVLHRASGVRAINYMYSGLRVSQQNRNLDNEFLPTMALVITEQLQQSEAEL